VNLAHRTRRAKEPAGRPESEGRRASTTIRGTGEAIESDIVVEARRLVRVAEEEGIAMRLLGGLAIHAHARGWTPPGPARTYADIDCAIEHGKRAKIGRLLERQGYRAKEPFNSLNPSRLVFYDVVHGRHVDLFVDEFEMCHRIVFANRLDVDPLTVPTAELLLTKLQIVEINSKDVQDIVTLLRTQEIRDTDEDGINGRRIAELLAGDWGLWRTATERLAQAPRAAGELGLAEGDRVVVELRVKTLAERIAAQPKSLGWRVRSKVGDRRRWYLEPEEIGHGERS
jgi:hypothetical protein